MLPTLLLPILASTAAALEALPPARVYARSESFSALQRRDGPWNRSSPAFTRFRPSVHFQPPSGGWMNDPCGPGYDPATGLYHLFFQWAPNATEWGNITWGHATSKDMISWKYDSAPAIRPKADYDVDGIFSGAYFPTGVDGSKGPLSIIYTSVSHLPISYLIPYTYGAETLSIATSHDRGRTWKRIAQNPILPGPPKGANVTGWRDPHLEPNSRIDKALGKKSGQNLYGVISGGVRNAGPTMWMYSIPRNNLTDWRYLGPLVEPHNYSSSTWTPSLGRNWEVSNIFNLGDKSFFITSAEGTNRTAGSERIFGLAMFAMGSFKGKDGGSAVSMKPSTVGVLDAGAAYAFNSFYDPVKDRRILWGWVIEDDTAEQRAQQGWAGAMTLPRHLYLYELCNIVSGYKSSVDDITSASFTRSGSKKSYTMKTLGVKPAEETEELRRRVLFKADKLKVGSGKNRTLDGVRAKSYELQAVVSVGEDSDDVGLVVRHDSSFNEYTKISLEPSAERISVDRSHSTLLPNITSGLDSAPFTLFRLSDPHTGATKIEPWQLRVFVDNSVIEIYANGRLALTSRVYPSRSDSLAVSLFGGQAWRDVKVWELGSKA